MFIAKRFKDDGPEIILPGLEWQMPQGGIDPNEDPRPAAVRELYEETGVTSVEYLGETPDWMTYDFPPYDGPPHRLAVFRGQRQKWFAFRFTGDEREIVVTDWRNGQEPEFDAWRWERARARAELVVPFRREIYAAVAREFARFAGREAIASAAARSAAGRQRCGGTPAGRPYRSPSADRRRDTGSSSVPIFRTTAGSPGRRVIRCVPHSAQKSRVTGRSRSLRVNCFGAPLV